MLIIPMKFKNQKRIDKKTFEKSRFQIRQLFVGLGVVPKEVDDFCRRKRNSHGKGGL